MYYIEDHRKDIFIMAAKLNPQPQSTLGSLSHKSSVALPAPVRLPGPDNGANDFAVDAEYFTQQLPSFNQSEKYFQNETKDDYTSIFVSHEHHFDDGMSVSLRPLSFARNSRSNENQPAHQYVAKQKEPEAKERVKQQLADESREEWNEKCRNDPQFAEESINFITRKIEMIKNSLNYYLTQGNIESAKHYENEIRSLERRKNEFEEMKRIALQRQPAEIERLKIELQSLEAQIQSEFSALAVCPEKDFDSHTEHHSKLLLTAESIRTKINKLERTNQAGKA